MVEIKKKEVLVTSEQVKNALSPKKVQRIFIGPNMLQLTTYTVVESDFPKNIESLIEKCPAVEKLFVPIAELTTAEPRTKTKGTIEHRNYIKVLEFISAQRNGVE
ncbi:hypothetical protein [Sporosarcina sp. FSL K6-5500]|uniref:hypothetical protein n=1 Tax=Sporosarcina sp. FSL K6-5500 TaxID=2921558 RepID=UPI0030F75AA1